MNYAQEQSKASKRREQRRNSPEMLDFRTKIIILLKEAEEDVAYSIQRDLSTMTDMPFYKQPKTKVKSNKNHTDMIKAYISLFASHDDFELVYKLLKELSKNQSQTIRKVVHRTGERKHIWEHVIPTRFFICEIIEMIRLKDLSGLDKLLTIYIKAGQRSVSKEENQLLSEYNSCMPVDWDWRQDGADPFIRHRITGIIK